VGAGKKTGEGDKYKERIGGEGVSVKREIWVAGRGRV